MAEILCAAQMKKLLGEKSNSRMDGHLKDVRAQQRSLFDMKGSPSKVKSLPKNSFTIASSQLRLANIKKNVEKVEQKCSKSFRRSNTEIR